MSESRTDREIAADWAKALLTRDDWIILDTETTGLDGGAEICQIAIIDKAGTALLDTLVQPTRPIPLAAMRIHGITNERVNGAPRIQHLLADLLRLCALKQIIIYNASYDTRVLRQSLEYAGVSQDRWVIAAPTPSGRELLGASGFACAMHWYSQWVGDWNDFHGNYRWQKLPGGDHTALGDARATLRVIERMAASASQPSDPPAPDPYAGYRGEGEWF